MKKYIYFFMLIILMITVVKAELNCSYDPNSYVTTTQDIKWSCYTTDFDNAKCYSLIYYGQDVLAIYPNVEYIQGIGMVDYFKTENGLVNIYFKTTDLYEGYNYTFTVMCGEIGGIREIEFSRGMTVVNRDLVEVPYRAIWTKDNMSEIIGFGILGLFILFCIFLVYKYFGEVK